MKKAQGFTLIELIITVAVIGILAAVAYPSYLDQIYKSKRATAAQSVLECTSVLERRYTLNTTYESTACDNINNDDYTLTVTVTGLTRPNRNCTANAKENCFLVTATSLVTDDTDCRTMTMNELGVKEAYKSDGTTLNTQECWRTT